jgi:hypothetical protein
VPDLFEGKVAGLPTASVQSVTTSITVDEQTYGSAAELPPELQEMLRQAFGWAAPGAAAVPAAMESPGSPGPLQAGQVMLNGVPTVVGDATGVRKPWWKRLFGG